MNLVNEIKHVSVFLNNDIKVSCEATVSPRMSVSDLLSECKEKLHLNNHSKCILFDSNGAELSDDDMEYMNPEEPLFLSLGEKFSKATNLAFYEEVKKIGHGGFGTVSLYRHKFTHQTVAIKFIKLKTLISPEDINRVYSEIGALRELKHPNIVTMHQTFLLNEEICFVMDYCSGGEIGSYLLKNGPFPENSVYSIALQIVDAIRYCHNSKIIHRDLKLENILFASDTHRMIKIVDFGIAGMCSYGNKGDRSDCGSILYIPPEIYKSVDNRASPALDIWAMGCIFYCLLTGKHPFMHHNVKEIINHIENVEYSPLPDNISKPWHKLIKGILRYNPQSRWDIIRIQEHLEKYCDSPNEPVSDDSEESKEINQSKKLKINTLSKRNVSGLLKVPGVNIKVKSQSPNRILIESPVIRLKASPRLQASSKKDLHPIQHRLHRAYS